MKIRNGYVSNSSSSSFIISYKRGDGIKIKGLEFSVEQFIQMVNQFPYCRSDSTRVFHYNKEQILDYRKDWYSEEQYERLRDLLKEEVEYIQLIISYHDKFTYKLMKFLQDRKKLKILEESER